jgi:hypothetical protein
MGIVVKAFFLNLINQKHNENLFTILRLAVLEAFTSEN